MRIAYAQGLVDERQLVEVELSRMKNFEPLTLLENSTALRLSDELDLVADDWRTVIPNKLWELRGALNSRDLLIIMMLHAAAVLDQNHEDDGYVWELESIFDALDVDGRFEDIRFFSTSPREDWEGKLSIREAILREAAALKD